MNLSVLRKLRPLIDLDREMRLRRLAFRALPVAHHSPYDAVFHVTAFKTASQWIRVILSDPRVYRRCGLQPFFLGTHSRVAADPTGHSIGARSLVLSMYANRETFGRVPKPETWRALVVARDPMDLLVSWHFSNRYTHPENPYVLRRREEMAGMTEAQALHCTIEHFGQVSDLLLPWLVDVDPRVALYRYEDLTGAQAEATWGSFMANAGVDLSGGPLRQLLHTYRQANLRPRRGQDDRRSHKYASGSSGSWKDVLNDDHIAEFRSRYADLLQPTAVASPPTTVPVAGMATSRSRSREQGGLGPPVSRPVPH